MKEFTDTYKNPKILFDAVYPAIAIDPKELTDDCSIAFEILITVLWIPAGTPTSKICFRYTDLIRSFAR